MNLGEYKAIKKRVNSDSSMTIWRFWISDCKYVLILVEIFAIDCSNAEFFAQRVVCVRVKVPSQQSVQPVRNSLNRSLCAANTYEHHHSITRLCSPFGLELMVKLTWNLKLAVMVRGVTFPMRLVVFGQSQCSGSVGQSEQTALVWRRDFVENDTFERGGA